MFPILPPATPQSSPLENEDRLPAVLHRAFLRLQLLFPAPAHLNLGHGRLAQTP